MPRAKITINGETIDVEYEVIINDAGRFIVVTVSVDNATPAGIKQLMSQHTLTSRRQIEAALTEQIAPLLVGGEQ